MGEILLIAALVTTGMSAGAFFAFTALVIPGLRDASTQDMLKGFQTIDRRLQPNSPSMNWQPLFGVVMFGPTPLLLAALIVDWVSLSEGARWLMIIANVLYTLGFWGTTVLRIVPFNNRGRDWAIDAMSEAELAQARSEFHRIWSGWNTVRTIAMIVTFVLVAVVVAEM